jgi:hypothetical protein
MAADQTISRPNVDEEIPQTLQGLEEKDEEI